MEEENIGRVCWVLCAVPAVVPSARFRSLALFYLVRRWRTDPESPLAFFRGLYSSSSSSITGVEVIFVCE